MTYYAVGSCNKKDIADSPGIAKIKIMLVVQNIIANKEAYVKSLAKRNIDAAPIFDKVIALDEERRATQANLDNTLADANKFSKEIGMLFKNGEQQKANILKEKTAQLKETSKTLSAQLTDLQTELETALYEIPNIPHDSVPDGQNDEDNEEVFKEGDIPPLEEKERGRDYNGH